jgi:lipoprotein-anchoring transpeptidase ErfK/SrfK
MARRRSRARSSPRSRPRRESSGGRGWLWVLVLALAGGTGWIWWRSAALRWSEAASEPAELPGFADLRLPPLPDLDSETGSEGDSGAPEPPRRGPEPSPAVPPRAVGSSSASVPAVSTATPAPTATSAVPAAVASAVPAPAAGATNGSGGGVGEEKPKVGATKVVAVQLALARRGISAGPVDGVVGAQTQAALRTFQRREGLPASGELDAATLRRLGLDEGGAYATYTVTAEDLARLTNVPRTWLGKSARSRLDYETVLELVSEKAHAHPRLIRQLNPQVDWSRVPAGTTVRVPAAVLPAVRARAAFVRISLGEKALRVYDARTNLLAHFPCSIARKVEKRPLGELRVARLAPNPNYRFDPEIFRESAEARSIGRKLMIPPGPNNPVGTAWIGLDRPGYGIHGTPKPEEVGRTESHGCFRLANWNAEYLMKLAWVGMPVYVEP